MTDLYAPQVLPCASKLISCLLVLHWRQFFFWSMFNWQFSQLLKVGWEKIHYLVFCHKKSWTRPDSRRLIDFIPKQEEFSDNRILEDLSTLGWLMKSWVLNYWQAETTLPLGKARWPLQVVDPGHKYRRAEQSCSYITEAVLSPPISCCLQVWQKLKYDWSANFVPSVHGRLWGEDCPLPQIAKMLVGLVDCEWERQTVIN